MKEIISAILLLITLLGGGMALKNFHNFVRTAALEKAAQGLPSLVEMNRALRKQKPKK